MVVIYIVLLSQHNCLFLKTLLLPGFILILKKNISMQIQRWKMDTHCQMVTRYNNEIRGNFSYLSPRCSCDKWNCACCQSFDNSLFSSGHVHTGIYYIYVFVSSLKQTPFQLKITKLSSFSLLIFILISVEKNLQKNFKIRVFYLLFFYFQE